MAVAVTVVYKLDNRYNIKACFGESMASTNPKDFKLEEDAEICAVFAGFEARSIFLNGEHIYAIPS